MIYDWFTGPVGRHNDQYFCTESDINGIMRRMKLFNNVAYMIYTDRGYVNDEFISAAARGIHVTPLQIMDNWIMSKIRVSIEWLFGKVRSRCPFLNRKYLMKLQGIDIERYSRVAILLTNAHTCIHQSQAGLYFDVSAPILEEYFN